MPTRFRRIAIVNRGEPAMRLIHTVRELCAGGRECVTIALFTEPDREGLFVREADEAHCLGEASFIDPRDGQRKSRYLDYMALERALVATHTDAAWVGWGFVAEHPEFARLCERLGIVFVGPSAEAMERVGDKIASKRLAEAAQVPVAPWSGGPVESVKEAEEHAERLGFPLMIKATAGGGGRGVRRIKDLSELEAGLVGARAEALKFFGSDVVFLEKALVGARHIEVQVLADHAGTCWAVGVRDCTVQRRSQKVVEEAPCPVLDPGEEQALREAAVRIAKAAGYTNAGTVEFLFDPVTRTFNFMEMNTRLQVEHPVTEMTTGLDLVAWQLAIAEGAQLEGPVPTSVGHAIEVRINAEDPDREFAPAPGWIDRLRLPTGPGLRIDTGFGENDQIAPDFDSMILKMIATGRTRGEALARLRRGLEETAIVVRGGTTNKGFLRWLLATPEFSESRTDIGWLDRRGQGMTQPARPDAAIALFDAAIALHTQTLELERKNFFVSASRGRLPSQELARRPSELGYQGVSYSLETRCLGPNRFRVLVDGQTVDIEIEHDGRFERRLVIGGRRHRVIGSMTAREFLVEVDQVPYRLSSDDGGVVTTPSPAIVLSVCVEPTQRVQAGAPLLVLEAMKMEMCVTAPYAARVRSVLVQKNAQVAAGAPLVLLEPEGRVKFSDSGPRLDFGAFAEQSAEPSWPRYRRHLEEVSRLVLGYEIHHKESQALLDGWAALRAELELAEPEVLAAEDAVLRCFVDLASVLAEESTEPFHPVRTPEQNLYGYLRAVDREGRGLPAAFLERLRRALVHYQLETLAPSPKLDAALPFLVRAARRTAGSAPHVFAILEHRLKHAEPLMTALSPSFRELLDQLIAVTENRDDALNHLARQARFRFFDRALFEGAATSALEAMEQHLACLEQPGDARAVKLHTEALVDCPYSLVGLLSAALLAPSRRRREIGLEVSLRRFFRVHELLQLTPNGPELHPVLSARFLPRANLERVVATAVDHGEIGRALSAARSALERNASEGRVLLDLYAVEEGATMDLEQTRQSLIEELARSALPAGVDCVCVSFFGPRPDKPIYSFSFVPDPTGGFVPHPLHPGMHPMVAERLEIWRLSNFRIVQLEAREYTYLFHAVAHKNPRDERLFAFIDVPDLTPVRDADGQVVKLPHLEHLYLEAVASMRQFQVQRSVRDRLQWNRIVLSIQPVFELGRDDVLRVARRLSPAARNLGLEKSVVRITTRDPLSLERVEQVLHIAERSGTGLRLRRDRVSDVPIRTLDAFDEKVVRMRRLNMVYAYEIIAMLAPSARGEQIGFPPGEFFEYDLDPHNQLVPVLRPMGENQANLVVGIIKNRTRKHPEGMERVLLVGDASREMGALAEPECRRIIAALDLAERLELPVEWFPVSSGAKIAMDVGTEALDWVARVLRRIIEFTQAGRVINLVVSGINVGGQSYFNAEATMLMHTKGILIMTPEAAMVLTGKRALDASGSVSAETHQGIGGYERIMGPNGEAQYFARSLYEACHILFRHYDHTYVVPGERFPRRAQSSDPATRDPGTEPHPVGEGLGFTRIAEIFEHATNPDRKKPFDIRSVMRAVIDQDEEPLERWHHMQNAETAVTWDAHLGGIPVCLLGIESRPLERSTPAPGDGPESWSGGTLFPESSHKVARAINAASGNRPVVVLANLSGFDGSPESMRLRQLEFGAEIGRAVVNFRGPMLFAVISRYHGGAYVVFSAALNPALRVVAVEGAHASVIGGAPAAEVVFPAEVRARALKDERVKERERVLHRASPSDQPRERARYQEVLKVVTAEKQAEVAELFDRTHNVERARAVGSLHDIIPASRLRESLIESLEEGLLGCGVERLHEPPTAEREHQRASQGARGVDLDLS